MSSTPLTEATFLNVDLVLRGSGLEKLIDALGDSIFVLHNEDGWVCLELAKSAVTADEAILAFAALVEGLTSDARSQWDNCELRLFDIGIQSGTSHTAGAFALGRRTLHHLVDLSAEITITVYPARQSG